MFKVRSLLGLPALLLIVLVGAACAGQQATPVIIEKEVIKEVQVIVEKEVIKEVPVIVEKEVIREVAVEVIKEVVVEKIREVEVPVIVEKQVIVQVIKEVKVEVPVERIVEKEVVVIKEVPVIIEKEVIVEVQVIKEVEVEKTVFVEKEVEKEVIRTVEVMVERPGRGAIDYTKYTSYRFSGAAPTSYNESPSNAALVTAGQLPAVGSRLPKSPLVLLGPDGIGKYGVGPIRDVRTATDFRNCCLAPDTLLDLSRDGRELEANIAIAWKVEGGGLKHIFTLREGMKFSDGAPFTSADYLFGFKTTVANTELMPNAPSWSYGAFAELPKVEAPDATTFSYTWSEPYNGFLRSILTNWKGTGAYNPIETGDALAYVPKHYMQQFTKGETDQASLDKLVSDGGYEDWTRLFRAKVNWYKWADGGTPVIGPRINKSGSNEGRIWTLEANPYYWEVDSAGNQLPYIHLWTSEQATSREIMSLKVIGGRSDHQQRHVDERKLTLFLLNGPKLGYEVLFVPRLRQDSKLNVNFTYDADPEVAKWIRNKAFRQALSMSIDRERIHSVIFQTLGEVWGYAPTKLSPLYLGAEWDLKKQYANYDPAAAKAIFDGLGLTKDAEGFYLRTDNGKRLELQLWGYPTYAYAEDLGPLVEEDWEAVGISTQFKLAPWPDPYNLYQFQIDRGGISAGTYESTGVEVGNWVSTKGAEGVDPYNTDYLSDVAKTLDLWAKYKATADFEEGVAIGKEMAKIAVEAQFKIVIHASAPLPEISHKDLRNSAVPQFGGWAHKELYFFDTPTGEPTRK